MTIAEFLETLTSNPDQIAFTDTMAVIDANFSFTPTAFTNGEATNAADENNGSCKLFAFAKQQQLTPAQTLACFGAYYREDVLQDPDGQSHQNIRQFMQHGWQGIKFEQTPLTSLS